MMMMMMTFVWLVCGVVDYVYAPRETGNGGCKQNQWRDRQATRTTL